MKSFEELMQEYSHTFHKMTSLSDEMRRDMKDFYHDFDESELGSLSESLKRLWYRVREQEVLGEELGRILKEMEKYKVD